MPRLVAAFVPAVFLFFLRSVLTPAGGHQSGHVAAAQLAVVRFLSERFAGGHVSDEAVGLALVAALLLTGIMGYVLHMVLEDRAFGPWLNGLLCFFGAAAADAAFVEVMPRGSADASALVMISSTGAVCLLLLFALLKAKALERLDDFGSGARPVGGSPHRRSAIPANRIGAATRRVNRTDAGA